MKKIKLGIVGCGRIFDKHYDAIKSKKNNQNINLVSICDADKKKLKKITDPNIQKYNNFKDFFDNSSNLDLVAICTPSGLHYEHCLMAAKKNLNALVEKPITLNFKQSQRLKIIFDKKKLNLFVVKQNRFNKTLIILKEIIKKNYLGKVYLANLNVFWHRHQKYYDQDKWKGTKQLDGGAIFNQASHHIDILNWLFGKIKSVSCVTSTIARKIQTEDTALINFKNNNGTLISANITVLSYLKNYECTLNIISEKGNLKIGGPALNKFEVLDVLNIDKIKKIFKKYNYNLNKTLNYGHEDVYSSLIEDLRNGSSTCPTAKNTIEVINLIESCHKSSRNKKNITIK